MKKINRRDYLLRMGVGVAGVIGAARLPLVGQTKNKKKSQTKKKALSARNLAAFAGAGLRWPITDVPPPDNPFVTVIYYGLIDFAYSDGFVDVLIHPGMDHHKFEIQLYKNPPNPPVNCGDPYKIIEPNRRDDTFFLKVPGQTTPPDVFQMPGALERVRTGGNSDKDFRWLPDLHSLDFYPEGYGLKAVPNSFRLEVYNGTFYTRLLTASTFDIVDKDAEKAHCAEGRYFGPIPLAMATAIDAKSNVELTWGREKETFLFTANDKYQIVFKNDCETCSAEPRNCDDERLRNDFHLNRKVLKVPQGRINYSLMLKDGCADKTTCGDPNFCIKFHTQRFNDEAPCMGSAFGKAPGFP